jgi:hypothetical protein
MIQFHKLPACDRYYVQPSLINAVGFIPTFLSESDPRPAREQFASNYLDGWRPTSVGFKLRPGPTPGLLDGDNIPKLCYPGDPDLPPLAYALLREEMIIVYPSAWVMVLQADSSHEIVRMD